MPDKLFTLLVLERNVQTFIFMQTVNVNLANEEDALQ
jgi:hypothetical protein